ncbi:glycine zipper 2TM domain-containing protein [Pseudomonadota bacterium]
MMARFTTLLIFILMAIPAVHAQQTSLSAAIDVHVFPREGQDEVQQSMDEADCYSWAADRTGTDPFELSRQANEQMAASEQAMAQAQQAESGTTGRNAAQGAIGGALVGAVFGSGSKGVWRGAAAGAATGAVVGGTRTRHAREDATGQVAAQSAQSQAATQEQMDDFRTAFTTCLEAKDYIAKF